MNSSHDFSMDQSFLDPQLSKNGDPYGPKRFKELVRECWFISDQLHTSYKDVLDMSVTERIHIMSCIQEKQETTQKAIAQARQQAKAK